MSAQTTAEFIIRIAAFQPEEQRTVDEANRIELARAYLAAEARVGELEAKLNYPYTGVSHQGEASGWPTSKDVVDPAAPEHAGQREGPDGCGRASQSPKAGGEGEAPVPDKDARIRALEGALVFCSGSADFADGGQAREGWLRLCAPLLASKGEEAGDG